MRARVGDLAIARFDPSNNDIKAGKKWDERVCIVTGTGASGTKSTRYYKIIYWDRSGVRNRELPPHRLVRARISRNYYWDGWDGNFKNLTIKRVFEVSG
jgi:hypothetical protein